MKKKSFEKKLVLNKTTLSNLNDARMNAVRGGTATGTGYRTIEKYCMLNSCGDECGWTWTCFC